MDLVNTGSDFALKASMRGFQAAGWVESCFRGVGVGVS